MDTWIASANGLALYSTPSVTYFIAPVPCEKLRHRNRRGSPLTKRNAGRAGGRPGASYQRQETLHGQLVVPETFARVVVAHGRRRRASEPVVSGTKYTFR